MDLLQSRAFLWTAGPLGSAPEARAATPKEESTKGDTTLQVERTRLAYQENVFMSLLRAALLDLKRMQFDRFHQDQSVDRLLPDHDQGNNGCYPAPLAPVPPCPRPRVLAVGTAPCYGGQLKNRQNMPSAHLTAPGVNSRDGAILNCRLTGGRRPFDLPGACLKSFAEGPVCLWGLNNVDRLRPS